MLTTTPEVPQHLRALARANEIRLARANLKRKLKTREVNPERIVLDPPECIENATVLEFLRALPRIRSKTASLILNRCSFSGERRLGDLTDRQRAELLSSVR